MTSSARRTLWTAAAFLLFAVSFWTISQTPGENEADAVNNDPAATQESQSEKSSQDNAGTAAAAPSPSAEDQQPQEAPERHQETREYALGLHELQGLPPTVAPGTTFELWTTLEAPVVDELYAGKLIPEVRVVEVIQPVTPEGPTAIVIAIPLKYMRDFTFAHRWGAFSVALL